MYVWALLNDSKMNNEIETLDITNHLHAAKIVEIIITKKNLIFFQKQQLFITDNGERYTLSNHILFCENQNNYKVLGASAVFDSKNTTILEVLYTFKITDDKKITFLKEQPEIIKIIKFNSLKYHINDSIKKASKEHEMSSKIKHLGIKEKMFHFRHKAGIIMNKMPGINLFDIILYLESTNVKISTKFLLSLYYSVLLSIHNQVKNYGLVHLDIKPQNLIVDFGTKANTINDFFIILKNHYYIVTNCIDYAFSKSIEDNNHTPGVCGTPGYLAPEVLNKKHLKHKEKPDVYAAGIILQILFRLTSFKTAEKILGSDLFKEAYKKISTQWIEDLPEHIFQIICLLSIAMVRTNPEVRLSLEQSINVFEYILEQCAAYDNLNPDFIYETVRGSPKIMEKITPLKSPTSLKNRSGEEPLFAKHFSPRENSVAYYSPKHHHPYKSTDNDKTEHNKFSKSDNSIATNKKNDTPYETPYVPPSESDYKIPPYSYVCFSKTSITVSDSLKQTITNIKKAAYTKTQYGPPNYSLKNPSGYTSRFWGNGKLKHSNQANLSGKDEISTTKSLR